MTARSLAVPPAPPRILGWLRIVRVRKESKRAAWLQAFEWRICSNPVCRLQSNTDRKRCTACGWPAIVDNQHELKLGNRRRL